MIRGVHHYLCMFNSCQFVQTLKNCRSLTIDHVVHRHMCCAYWLELACSWQCIICLMAIALVLNEVDTIPRCLKNSGDMCIYIYIIQINYWLYVISIVNLSINWYFFQAPFRTSPRIQLEASCMSRLQRDPALSRAWAQCGWNHGGQLDGSWKSHGFPHGKIHGKIPWIGERWWAGNIRFFGISCGKILNSPPGINRSNGESPRNGWYFMILLQWNTIRRPLNFPFHSIRGVAEDV